MAAGPCSGRRSRHGALAPAAGPCRRAADCGAACGRGRPRRLSVVRQRRWTAAL
ncbi:MAG TPA: citramalate synthase [Stenotrophomonas sp.]|nr:citramalate synthase [Stenotrophomonas sp.]